MQPYGSDRVRVAGGKVILHSRLPKGWTPRTPKVGTHSEFPGTAVLWDDQYFEVVAADALPAGGVRYQLAPWPDEHTFRVFTVYDEASEARLLADHQAAAVQRARSRTASFSSMLLGHLPGRVQNRLANDYGLFPARMTILSGIPPLLLVLVCVLASVEALLHERPSPIPAGLIFFAGFMFADAIIRFYVAMSQNRGVGSILGTLLYAIYELVTRKRPSAPARPPLRLDSEDPERDVLDSVHLRGWLITLLTPREQQLVAERYGYDYRKDAHALAWALLIFGAIGCALSLPNAPTRPGAFAAALTGALLAVEQAARLHAFRKGPAGSVLAVLARPFVKDLLRARAPRDS